MIKKEQILVSIIIPVYKVEEYLSRCIESVTRQTYSNIEVILVDDGSPDNCPQLCDELAKKDSRIEVVHKKNGGLSTARNAGLDVAKGDFICFVDSDDWICHDALEYSVGLAQMHSADMVETGIYCTEKFVTEIPVSEKVSILSGKSILQDYMFSTTKGAGYSVCKCMFSSKVLQNLRFRVGFNNEDIDFKYKALTRCETIVKSNKITYFYFQGNESITTGGFRKKDYDLDVASQILANLTKDETYGDISYLGKVKLARCAFSHLCKIAFFGMIDNTIDKKEEVKKLTAEHRKNVGILLKSPMAFSRKILVVMFAINYKMTEVAIHLAQKL